ncbi:hypothetical protein RHMOL_Rhmol11G0067600 [Rhododendron molle]|uniref:Uncharacterized protein n=1 Tax=Rhododendron molle TaxID=49168 RepID=A0ACC0LQC3_RHOML|nr:hypothetical protein RHMOL_Rhmol11G0067600 [Rhododendron molle]
MRNWGEVQDAFTTKFFPASQTKLLIDQIQSFKQRDGETYHKYWERYKDLLMSIPHHNFPFYLRVNYFYTGCSQESKQLLDTMGGGDFMGKTSEDAWDYYETLAEKTQSWQFADPEDRAMFNQGPSGSGKFSIMEHRAFETRLEEIARKLDKLELKSSQSQKVKVACQVEEVSVICKMVDEHPILQIFGATSPIVYHFILRLFSFYSDFVRKAIC